ncbi:MAG: hypothetical protein U1E59_21230 [Amaricoccus sp.]
MCAVPSAQLIRIWIRNIHFSRTGELQILDILLPMDHDEKQRLARTGDVSKEAVSYRLRAARAIRPRRSQKAMAAEEFGVAISTLRELGDR